MTGNELRQHYLDYLSALNERRFDDLQDFVANDVSYNGGPVTLAAYQQARRREAALIPDLRFRATTLVVEFDRVAAILAFACTPDREWLGLDFDGRTISFTEHVFYRFDGPLIVDVMSLLDRPAIESQAVTPRRGIS